ncbi:MAG: hypothetical protein KGI29_07585 [Pseudomonadota bacterium]|nr:hypothetical protein [Pseudomonadota bacterium]MDE3037479.1 hypothetical protein [Pseudomonadota bacterium]
MSRHPGAHLRKSARLKVLRGHGVVRAFLLVVALYQTGGCIITPRFETTEAIHFDAPSPTRQQLSYDDLLCCQRCQA